MRVRSVFGVFLIPYQLIIWLDFANSWHLEINVALALITVMYFYAMCNLVPIMFFHITGWEWQLESYEQLKTIQNECDKYFAQRSKIFPQYYADYHLQRLYILNATDLIQLKLSTRF